MSQPLYEKRNVRFHLFGTRSLRPGAGYLRWQFFHKIATTVAPPAPRHARSGAVGPAASRTALGSLRRGRPPAPQPGRRAGQPRGPRERRGPGKAAARGARRAARGRRLARRRVVRRARRRRAVRGRPAHPKIGGQSEQRHERCEIVSNLHRSAAEVVRAEGPRQADRRVKLRPNGPRRSLFVDETEHTRQSSLGWEIIAGRTEQHCRMPATPFQRRCQERPHQRRGLEVVASV